MTRLMEKFRLLADRWCPERQILVRGGGGFSSHVLSQRLQLTVLGLGAAGFFWLAVSSVTCLATLAASASATGHEAALHAALAVAQGRLRSVMAQNATMTAARDAALAQADALRDAALAQADQARRQAAAQTRQIAGQSAAELGALTQETQQEITAVQDIMRAAGLNPARFAKAAPPAQAPDGAELLRRDLGQLHSLSGVLGQMPLTSPVADMQITSPFGYRPNPWTGAREFHVGIDLRGAIGTPIYATAPGIVSFAGAATGYGLIVEIDHGYGLSTRYSHLNTILVHAGQTVALHQPVGCMGNTGWSTGPHLLYETRVDGTPQNPLQFIKVSSNEVPN